jgi:hypothetical protein
MIRVFNGVSIPNVVRKGPSARYPTEDLEVGQSFFIETNPADEKNEAETTEHAVKRMASACVRVSKKFPGRKFRARAATHPETGESVVGVWRVA